MLLQFALIIMTLIVALFVFAWACSAKLRRALEEPKYSILANEPEPNDH